MRKLLYGVVAVVLASVPAHAQSLTDFFKNSNLDPLAKSPLVLNLEGQSASKTAQSDVNVFDDFFLINGPGKLVVNFDKQLQSKGDVAIRGWIGVLNYSNHDISADLQDGWKATATHFKLGDAKAAHVVVYKTLNTHRLVYDYAVQPASGGQRCQEYLYIPDTKGFQKGLTTACFWTLDMFKRPVATSAGKPGK